jgi:hypothetical protein
VVQDLIRYELGDGQRDAEALGYIPLPQNVADKGIAAISNLAER